MQTPTSGHRFAFFSCLLVLSCFMAGPGRADGPEDNLPDSVRRIPPLGIEVPEAQRAEVQAGLDALKTQLDSLDEKLKGKPDLLALKPDAEIYHQAVRYALEYQEFQKEGEIQVALELLKTGGERAAALLEGKAPWTRQTGLVVRGYRSRIDGSAQPYGLVIPESYGFEGAYPHRLDFWFHGRGEKTNEVAFIRQRETQVGQTEPKDTIVLHPYARFSNANKFAGEIDCLEALEHAQSQYRIDENRIFVRGFSMGGAATWQFAVHYPGRWAGATPGAGFSETEDFLRTFQGEDLKPAWYEKKLWHLYDCTDWAVNLFNCPTIAYSGELDRQKQAADMMEKALAGEDIELVHIIGPQTEHKIHPDSKIEIEERLEAIAAMGRNPAPRRVRFTTWTLRYNECAWVRVDEMTAHWERARIDAELAEPNAAFVDTGGVEAFTLTVPPGHSPLDATMQILVEIDGHAVPATKVKSDRSWTAHFRKDSRIGWVLADAPGPELKEGELRKKHGLQGPIDDAFMDSFMFVEPTGEPMNAKTGEWVKGELDHAITHWRQQFRGDARVKKDSEISDEDIAAHNLVLWGDPGSNSVLKRIADKLPIRWKNGDVVAGDKSYRAASHMPVLIYPNPLNLEKYVVLNSSFTYREYDYLNNARQVPKLPDWAVIDVSKPVTSLKPGGIAAAGFFDERWRMKKGED